MSKLTGPCCLLAVFLASGVSLPLAAHPCGDLVTVIRDGGLTPSGGFHSETRIETDGTLLYHDNTGSRRAHLAPAELRLLVQELKMARFSPLRPNKGAVAHRSAYDGLDEVVTFTTTRGRGTLTDPVIGNDTNAPVLRTLQQIEAKYLP